MSLGSDEGYSVCCLNSDSALSRTKVLGMQKGVKTKFRVFKMLLCSAAAMQCKQTGLPYALLGCAEEALTLARAAAQAALSGRGRLQIVRRIAEATSAARQAPAMRAKAIRALSGVVKADTGLLALPDIQHSVNGALKVRLQASL